MAASMHEPRSKLAWAHHHIKTLDDDITRFFDDGGYSVRSDFDAETEQHVIAVQIAEEAPLTRWGLRMGDVLGGLRSALDYTVYQLAIEGTGQEPPPNCRDLQFPIFKSEDGKRGYDVKSPKQIAGIPDEAAAIIKSIQPFKAPSDPLAILNALSNTDKHRTLHVAIAVLRKVHARDVKTVGKTTAEIGLAYVHPDSGVRTLHSLYDGMELGRARFGDTETNRAADVQTDAAFDVLFDKGSPKPIEGEVITDVLQALAQAVGEILSTLSTFIPEVG